MRKAILCAVVVILACGLALGAVQEKVLHSFGGEPDGINPWAGLTIDASGNLYGTTGFGGNPGCFSDEGCGTVFQLVLNFDGSWTENVIYRFKGGADGDLPGPFGKLVLDDSENLYGTTQRGGDLACAAPNGCGTVFKLTPNGDGTWTQSVIYTFEGGPDGGSPGSVSFDNEGNLLGVAGGGTYNNGLIFELTPNQDGTWTKTTVYSFRGDPDGSFPGRLVLDKNGDFYGAAQDGGKQGCVGGCGTIFKLTKSNGTWTGTLLYAFAGQEDGANPRGALTLDASGNLFGTAYWSQPKGAGLVFMLTPRPKTWKLTVLHRFNHNPGAHAAGDLAFDKAGRLFGTTEFYFNDNSGTVFGLARTNDGVAYRTVHAFNGADGYYPISGVIVGPDGRIYGTTEGGGDYNMGVVFEITP